MKIYIILSILVQMNNKQKIILFLFVALVSFFLNYYGFYFLTFFFLLFYFLYIHESTENRKIIIFFMILYFLNIFEFISPK